MLSKAYLCRYKGVWSKVVVWVWICRKSIVG